MPDQTPVTDDDRRNIREDAETVRNSPGSQRTAVRLAEYVLDTVPAPPATLADELREYAKDYATVSRRSMLRILADRVEAVVQERDEAQQDAVDAWEHAAQTDRDHVRAMGLWEQDYARVSNERDAARAEVELLAAQIDRMVETYASEVERLKDRVDYLENGDWLSDDPTDPADVPEGVPYDIYYGNYGKDHTVGVRIGREWLCIGDDNGVRVTDQNIASLTRLVPDTRRVIDRPEGLDALPVGSIVLDEDGDPWKKITEVLWMYGQLTSSARLLLQEDAEVTVTYEPMSDSGDGRTPGCPARG